MIEPLSSFQASATFWITSFLRPVMYTFAPFAARPIFTLHQHLTIEIERAVKCNVPLAIIRPISSLHQHPNVEIERVVLPIPDPPPVTTAIRPTRSYNLDARRREGGIADMEGDGERVSMWEREGKRVRSSFC